MIALHFDIISRYDRKGEFVETAVPFAKSVLHDVAKLMIVDGGGGGGKNLPSDSGYCTMARRLD
jgi:hypothetical protein